MTDVLAEVGRRGERQHSVAIVAPLREGMQEAAADLPDEGPPFAAPARPRA